MEMAEDMMARWLEDEALPAISEGVSAGAAGCYPPLMPHEREDAFQTAALRIWVAERVTLLVAAGDTTGARAYAYMAGYHCAQDLRRTRRQNAGHFQQVSDKEGPRTLEEIRSADRAVSRGDPDPADVMVHREQGQARATAHRTILERLRALVVTMPGDQVPLRRRVVGIYLYLVLAEVSPPGGQLSVAEWAAVSFICHLVDSAQTLPDQQERHYDQQIARIVYADGLARATNLSKAEKNAAERVCHIKREGLCWLVQTYQRTFGPPPLDPGDDMNGVLALASIPP